MQRGICQFSQENEAQAVVFLRLEATHKKESQNRDEVMNQEVRVSGSMEWWVVVAEK
jgi:hypothetical protein